MARKKKEDLWPMSADAKLLFEYAVRERDMANNKFQQSLKTCGYMSGVPRDADPSTVVIVDVADGIGFKIAAPEPAEPVE